MITKNWDDFLNTEIDCECGVKHRCDIDKIIVEENAISKLSDIIMSGFYHNSCVVCDSTTEEIAGKTVYQELRNNLIQFEPIVLKEQVPIADERTVGEIMMQIAPKCDLIIAVGSGTINDLCKFISFKLGIDYIIIATAPSMDGYASNVAPMIVNNLKTTYEVGLAKAIIADTTILANAPYAMLTSGIGDILGKYVCLTDWKLSNIVTGEYYCEWVEKLVREAIELVVEAVSKIKERDKEAISSIMEALIFSGIAMSFVGNSRPASGSEHHLSHFWEIMFLQKNMHCALHGTKVAVGTVITLKLYEGIRSTPIRIGELAAPDFDEKMWEENIIKVYGVAAEDVIALENTVHKNSNEAVMQRREVIEEKMDEINSLIDHLPKSEEIINLLHLMEAPYLPEQINVDQDMLKNSILYAKELRNRYGILQLLFDLDELDKFQTQEVIE
ncbi:MAG: sn-glycerol-1-phosphate dehydrogenase [Lachnotalea sp.]